MKPFALPLCRPGPGPAGRARGFTLIELLVVIAIIGILASLLLPVLSAAKARALRARCLVSVKQITLAYIAYAIDHNDRLPGFTAGAMPIYADPETIKLMTAQYGLTQDLMYCPAFPEFNNNYFWTNNVFAVTDPQTGVTSLLLGIRTIGYCLTMNETRWDNESPTIIIDPATTIASIMGADFSGNYIISQPSKNVLVADMVSSVTFPVVRLNRPIPLTIPFGMSKSSSGMLEGPTCDRRARSACQSHGPQTSARWRQRRHAGWQCRPVRLIICSNLR